MNETESSEQIVKTTEQLTADVIRECSKEVTSRGALINSIIQNQEILDGRLDDLSVNPDDFRRVKGFGDFVIKRDKVEVLDKIGKRSGKRGGVDSRSGNDFKPLSDYSELYLTQAMPRWRLRFIGIEAQAAADYDDELRGIDALGFVVDRRDGAEYGERSYTPIALDFTRSADSEKVSKKFEPGVHNSEFGQATAKYYTDKAVGNHKVVMQKDVKMPHFVVPINTEDVLKMRYFETANFDAEHKQIAQKLESRTSDTIAFKAILSMALQAAAVVKTLGTSTEHTKTMQRLERQFFEAATALYTDNRADALQRDKCFQTVVSEACKSYIVPDKDDFIKEYIENVKAGHDRLLATLRAKKARQTSETINVILEHEGPNQDAESLDAAS